MRLSALQIFAITIILLGIVLGNHSVEASPSLYYGTGFYNPTNAIQNSIPLDLSATSTFWAEAEYVQNGTKFIATDVTNRRVYQLALSEPYNISTVTSSSFFFVGGEESAPADVTFSDDGTMMFIIGYLGDRIFKYNLGTAFDVTTAVYAGIGQSLSVNALEGTPVGLDVNNDGTKMFVYGQNSDMIRTYDLAVAYDPSTGVENAGERLTGVINAFDFYMLPDGTRLLTITGAGSFRYYTLGTPFTLSSASVATTGLIPGLAGASIWGFSYYDSGARLTLGRDNGLFYDYSMRLASSTYTESVGNDGTVTGSLPIFLAQDTFQDTDADDILDVGSEVTVGNLPAGLTPVFTLSAGDTVATMTLVGTSTVHQNADDVVNLSLVFDNTAFVGNDASVVNGSGTTTPYLTVGVDFLDNPVEGDVELSSSTSSSIDETSGSAVNFPVLLVNGTVTGTRSVELDITGGTAVLATDYTSTDPIVVTIPAGVYDGTVGTAITITVPTIVDDAIVEGAETITFSLINPTIGIVTGDADGDTLTTTTHTYTITDDDVTPTPSGGGGGRSSGRRTCSETVVVNCFDTVTRTVRTATTPVQQPPQTNSVLTAPTNAINNNTVTCSKYISVLQPIDMVSADVDNIKKIQTFLNTHEHAGLTVDGVYTQIVKDAVKKFQSKYTEEILSPWGHRTPTGVVFTTTAAKMNAIHCTTSLTCPVFTSYFRLNESGPEVVKIRELLNLTMDKQLDTKLEVYDTETRSAVMEFQNRYKEFVLKPWGIDTATGYWYKTSVNQANRFMGCPTVSMSL